MDCYIIYNNILIEISRNINEDDSTFIKRISFFIKSLEKGYTINKAETYSYIYLNKLLYNTKYNNEIEENIKIIDS